MTVRHGEMDDGSQLEIADFGKPLPRIIDKAMPYRVLDGDAPLFGMPYPPLLSHDQDRIFDQLANAGVRVIINLVKGYPSVDPSLNHFDCKFFPITDGGPKDEELGIFWEAVAYAQESLQSGKGVVIHCLGGNGRTGTVIGCVLRKQGKGSGEEIVAWLDQLSKARDKGGWPEARVQSKLVQECQPDERGSVQAQIDPEKRNVEGMEIPLDEESSLGTVVSVEGDRVWVRLNDTGEIIETNERFLRKDESAKKINVYFSDLLPRRYPKLFDQVQKSLCAEGVDIILLPHTKDIWCRDYMPVEDATGEFVQFRYNPSYQQTKQLRETITDAAETCQAIGIRPRRSNLVVDGGNVVRFGSHAIVTDRVFAENPSCKPDKVKKILKQELKLDVLGVIPADPDDPFGHADGCVRFIDQRTVLINASVLDQGRYGQILRLILDQQGFSWVDMPYFIDYDSKHKDSAVGNYLNYLEIGNVILAPSYKGHEQDNARAVEVLQRAFGRGKKIIPIESTSVAKEGGILNCVSWS